MGYLQRETEEGKGKEFWELGLRKGEILRKFWKRIYLENGRFEN